MAGVARLLTRRFENPEWMTETNRTNVMRVGCALLGLENRAEEGTEE